MAVLLEGPKSFLLTATHADKVAMASRPDYKELARRHVPEAMAEVGEIVSHRTGINPPARIILSAAEQCYGDDLRYHGSPVAPEDLERKRLEPRQATWQDEKGRRYNHGTPAIAASDKPALPVVRSLLQDDHPALKGEVFFVLTRQIDARGNTFFLTARPTIERLAERQATGTVYTFSTDEDDPASTTKYFDPVLKKELDEYRITRPIPLVETYPVTTTVNDLPSNLLVIEGTIEEATRFSRRIHESTIVVLSDEMGIPVKPLRGNWPLEVFPQLEGK